MKRNSKHVCDDECGSRACTERNIFPSIFSVKKQKKKKKNHSERGQFQVRLDKRKYLRPLIISIYNLSPLYISPALCQRASERFADVWHVSLGCEVDTGWIHKTSTKTRQPPPLTKYKPLCQKCVSLVTQFFRHKNKRYTSPLPLIARLLKRPSSQHTHIILLNTPFSYFLSILCTSWEIRPIILSICSLGAYWYKGDCRVFAKLLPHETTKVATGSLLRNNKQTEFLRFFFLSECCCSRVSSLPSISFE